MGRTCEEIIGSQCAPVLMDIKPSNLLILTAEKELHFLYMEQVPAMSALRLYSGGKNVPGFCIVQMPLKLS